MEAKEVRFGLEPPLPEDVTTAILQWCVNPRYAAVDADREISG